jgi:mRNA interferase MazF
LVAAVTSKTAVAMMPGNVFLPTGTTDSPRDSVVNVTPPVTLDTADPSEQLGQLPSRLLDDADSGLPRVLSV